MRYNGFDVEGDGGAGGLGGEGGGVGFFNWLFQLRGHCSSRRTDSSFLYTVSLLVTGTVAGPAQGQGHGGFCNTVFNTYACRHTGWPNVWGTLSSLGVSNNSMVFCNLPPPEVLHSRKIVAFNLGPLSGNAHYHLDDGSESPKPPDLEAARIPMVTDPTDLERRKVGASGQRFRLPRIIQLTRLLLRRRHSDHVAGGLSQGFQAIDGHRRDDATDPSGRGLHWQRLAQEVPGRLHRMHGQGWNYRRTFLYSLDPNGTIDQIKQEH